MDIKRWICMILIGCMFLTVGCQKVADETKDLEDVNIQEEEEEQTVGALTEVSYPRELTQQELQDMTEWIRQNDNYGFLLSAYERPQEILWDEVFYNGAGLEMTALSEQERQKYLESNSQEEIYTDVNRLTKAQIEEFVLKKTGVSYEEMEKPLSWVCLPEEEICIMEHGDTNYMYYTCVGGQQTDGEQYVLKCVPGDGEEEQSYYTPCELTLKKSGEGYLFCANRFVEGFEQ